MPGFFYASFSGNLVKRNSVTMHETGSPELLSRIAPTPSGYLHAGNAFSFVLTWLLVRKMGAKLLLRIDDSDAARSRPEFIEDIFYTLDWLGLDYELGPQGPDDFVRNFSQQHRLELYSQLLEDLRPNSGRVYACRCSRRQIQTQSRDGLYPGSCREKELPFHQENTAWRIRVGEETMVAIDDMLTKEPVQIPLGKQMGDFVIRRKDALPAYQVVSLADDMHYGVNFIVRGSDLYGSTAAQLFLATCLVDEKRKFEQPAKAFLQVKFCHHGLILNQEGEKLSKSRGAASVKNIREAGGSPSEIYQRVAAYVGVEQRNAETLENLLNHFNPDHFQKKIKTHATIPSQITSTQ